MTGVDDIVPLIPIISRVPDMPGFPWLGPGLGFPLSPDLSNVDNEDENEDLTYAYNRLKQLEDMGYKKSEGNNTVMLDPFVNETFESIHQKIKDADNPLAQQYSPQDWADVRAAIVEAKDQFELELGHFERQEEGWKGKTHDAAVRNITASLPEPATAADGAGVQGILVEAFQETIAATQNNIVNNKSAYDRALADFPEYTDEINDTYDKFARTVMQEVYSPNIVQIARDNPAFTAGVTLDVGDNGPGPDGPGPFGPGNGPGSFGGGDLPGPPGTPEMPEFDTPKFPDTPNLPETPEFPTTPTDTPTLPQSLGQPPGGPPSPASSGGGPPPGSDAGRPPEGVLGLGPKGLGGAPKGGPKGGGAGGKAGGGAGGGLPRGLAPGKATATPAAAVRTPAVGAGAGAGMGAMGPPGAGAPAAGAAGRDGNKGHQVLKALRRKKTGQEVAGEAEAVVPVVGAPERPVKPETNQPDQAAQADSPEDGGVRTVSRGAQSTEQATRMPGQ
jgi:hypothetical protein